MKKLLSFLVLMLFALSFASYGIKAEEAQQGEETLSLTVKSYFDSENIVTNTVTDQTYGSKVAMNGNLSSEPDYDFAYWIVNGVVRDDLPVDHTFTMTFDLELIGVFYPTDPVEYLVMFMDSNGHSIDWEYVSSGTSATAPGDLPDKPGYLVDDQDPWSESFSNVTNNVVTVLRYEKDSSATHTLTVNGGELDTGEPEGGVYNYNDIATVVADAPEAGESFHHWETEDRIVSYQSTYSFTMLQDTSLTAVYSTSAPADEPSVTVSHNLALRTGYESYLGQFYLPTGYELVEFGVLTSTSTDYLDLDTAGAIRNKGEKFNGTTNEFLMSIQDSNAVSRRGYLIAKDSLGDLVTVYDEAAYSVVNGGFETGDLTGWNSHNIWKDEAPMISFTDERVDDETYFGGNYPYDRDGSYNLGLGQDSGDSLGWDQVSERMGHLRSSNFTLGGSGYISFKLGGGRSSDFAYISVRKTIDNTEVARFGNRHFNDTTVATNQYGSTIDNAEAFLFQYYFDLSSVGTIGESYYLTITEASSFEWAILSADSFVTHYKTAPTTTADTLATNIVPDIQTEATVQNQIVNNLSSNLDDWQDVNSNFYFEDGLMSNKNDNNGTGVGVFRSKAFSLDGSNQYLRFDFRGGRAYDKQIYVSIKEYGTNIEVMRIVRRDNQAANNWDYHNHMADLSSLPTDRYYYIEISDNKIGDWGIIGIKNIRLIDSTEWDGVIDPHPGDEAVYITPLETRFIYVYE